jgi:hypothetical protein
MPTATFYPSVTSQPVAGEGVFINGADSTDWVNVTTKINQDYALTTDVGSLTGPDVNSLSPATPPAATDTRLASQFGYTNIGAATLGLASKMARGITLLRTSDNAAISTVIPATATAITSIVASFRFADTSYGIDSVGGSGAAVYGVEMQQRNASGAIGSMAQIYSLYDYTAVSLYCYYTVNAVVFGTLPTVSQLRSTDYGINFRASTNDSLETTPYIGINGLVLTIAWTEPEASNRVRRQLVRLPDGRLAAARARIR